MINQTETSDLAVEEWEFSNVPNTHLEACFLFEYSRESVKEGNKLPVELLDIISTRRGFPNRPFQCLSSEDQERVFIRHGRVKGEVADLANTYIIREMAASMLLKEALIKKKFNSRMLRQYLKQLGVLRLFKGGHTVEKAMQFTFGFEQDDKDWLSRSKYRQYQREARRRVEAWPSCVIPRAELSR